MTRVRRFQVWVGNTLEVVGLAVGIAAVILARTSPTGFEQFALFLVGWVFLLVFPHCLFHYIVGSMVGIKFQYYFLGPSGLRRLKLPVISNLARSRILPGLKVKPESLKSAGKVEKAAMFSAGTAASMLLPILSPALAFGRAPTWIVGLLAALTAANILFTLYYSPKAGDIWRAKRALKDEL